MVELLFAGLPLAPEGITPLTLTPEQEKEVSSFTVSIYNNLSAALLASPDSDPSKVVKYTNEVIDREPKNEKAWHRKGTAYFRYKEIKSLFNIINVVIISYNRLNPQVETI